MSSQGLSFEADGTLFRLVSEGLRIRWAHLFERFLAVETSLIEPLPHQVTAVYEVMLRRQPLRFLGERVILSIGYNRAREKSMVVVTGRNR